MEEERAMQIKDVMTRDATIISTDTSIADAAAQMAALDVGPLPVCNGERLVGVVTDRDIATRAVAAGKDPRTTAVREAMPPT
jgi:CBS domain-containing protein